MIKIKKMTINGLRGIRKDLSLDLSSAESLLVYGDNGSGKSSITDVLEWNYYGKIDHLSIEEIGRKGLEALRNHFLPFTAKASFELLLSNSKLDAKKEVTINKSGKIQETCSNSTPEYEQYIQDSSSENLILRFRNLGDFILKTKSDKLHEISAIIGYEKIKKTQDELKKTLGELKKQIKHKDFEGQISLTQNQIIGEIDENINNDKEYLEAMQKLIEPLNLKETIKTKDDVQKVINSIATSDNSLLISKSVAIDKIEVELKKLKSNLPSMVTVYTTLLEKCKKVSENKTKIGKIALDSLLAEGHQLLQNNLYSENNCPLCLQEKDREELLSELKDRIKELEDIKAEKTAIMESISSVKNELTNYISSLKQVLSEKLFEKDEYETIKTEIEGMKNHLMKAVESLKAFSAFESETLQKIQISSTITQESIEETISKLSSEKNKIKKEKKGEQIFQIHSKLKSVTEKHNRIEHLKKELEVFEGQTDTIETVYNSFVKAQKEAMNVFLEQISKEMNELYLFMNPDEKVDKIQLTTLGEGDELLGITIEYEFHGETVSAPNRFLSESHLNCLGICLFLMSVKTFNKKNKFFILDDVISSFDKKHRYLFARLLFEKFNEYQILLFTHEDSWFQIVENMAKGKNWTIKSFKWDHKDGVKTEVPLCDLHDKINTKIKDNNYEDLGNNLRTYLENMLKKICYGLQTKVNFLFNNENEDRMSHELLSSLKSTMKKQGFSLEQLQLVDRLSNSSFLGNKTSHDSSIETNINDLKVFFNDIEGLKSIFYCKEDNCMKFVSFKYFDNASKKIKCKCGNIQYSWK